MGFSQQVLSADDEVDQQITTAVLLFKTRQYQHALLVYNDIISKIMGYSLKELDVIRLRKYNLDIGEKTQENNQNLSQKDLKTSQNDRNQTNQKKSFSSSTHPKLGAVLDQRAATYEKLGKLQRALRDGETIIAFEPVSCKGYLRTGKTLGLLGRQQEAQRVFEKGIKTILRAVLQHGITVPERLFESLKDQCKPSGLQGELNKMIPLKRSLTEDGLKRELKSSTEEHQVQRNGRELNTLIKHKEDRLLKRDGLILKVLKRDDLMLKVLKRDDLMKRKRSSDPFITLPPDIIELVFHHFKLKFVLNCHLVCKRWYHILTNIPLLYLDRVHFKNSISQHEFLHGVKLIKRITERTFSQRIKSFKINSTINAAQLKRVLETVISEPNFSIGALDIYDRHFNFQVLLNRLAKYNWRLNNLQSLESLRCGINSSIRYENVLLNVFKNLKVLHVMVLLPEMSGTLKQLVPRSDKLFCRYREDPRKDYPNLEVLVLVNHAKLMRGEANVSVSGDTFNPYPVLLTKVFPNLRELTLVSFDFRNLLPQLGDFFLQTPHLRTVYFENNENFLLLELMQLLKNYNPPFTLNKLTFREKCPQISTGLTDFAVTDLPQLHGLRSLDVNGNTLTNNGLMQLLRIVNRHNHLRLLSFAASSFLRFRTDVFANRSQRNVLWLYDILTIVPGLTSLDIHELEVDHHTMLQFYKDIVKFGISRCALKVLDISFCQVGGIGLINLFNATPTNIKAISAGEPAFQLDRLVVDGVELNQSTLGLLLKYGFVADLRADDKRKRWREFGVNSLVM